MGFTTSPLYKQTGIEMLELAYKGAARSMRSGVTHGAGRAISPLHRAS